MVVEIAPHIASSWTKLLTLHQPFGTMLSTQQLFDKWKLFIFLYCVRLHGHEPVITIVCYRMSIYIPDNNQDLWDIFRTHDSLS